MDFAFKSKPFSHQLSEFLGHRADPVRGIFWEQGTGKSKAAIDRASWLFTAGCIDCLIIVAPDGVHANWTMINDTPETYGELQKHAWPGIVWKAFTFHTSKADTKRHLEEGREVWAHKGLAVLSITYDAIMTPKGQKVFEGFLKRKCHLILDESTRIKTPNAKRTKRLIALGKRAAFRDILSGTPVAESPFDAYSQVRFLDPEFWVRNGIPTFTAFKSEFALLETFQQDETGRWQKVDDPNALDPEPEPEPAQLELADAVGYDYGAEAGAGWEFPAETDGGRKPNGVVFQREAKHFTKVKEFRNLDRLHELLSRISTRVTKDQVLDLPDKMYTMRLFDMTREQRRIYTDLKEEALAWLDKEQTEMVSGILPIVRLLRLQQITNGYVSPDGSDDVTMIEGRNPRLELLRDISDDAGQVPLIIWARFQKDIDLIEEQLRKDGHKVAVVDGRIVGKAREQAKLSFKDGSVLRYVANPAAAAEGDTFVHCRRVVYYSNSFRLSHRLQSEDRTHRIGQTESVLYEDLACAGTVDFKLIQALRAKQVISSQVLGDTLRQWLI